LRRGVKASRRQLGKANARAQALPRPASVYAVYRQGTAAASRAFCAAHEARIRQVKVQIEARWKRVASRRVDGDFLRSASSG